jgi:hypothetical protein
VCPEGFPVTLPTIFFEHTWDTSIWNGQGEWPFVWANGDPTGWGFHGDFLNGWDVPILQEAMDTCTDMSGVIENCAVFTSKNLIQTPTEQGKCILKAPTTIDYTGALSQLPGCNPIQAGPADAVMATTNCNAVDSLPAVKSATGSTTTSSTTSPTGTNTSSAVISTATTTDTTSDGTGSTGNDTTDTTTSVPTTSTGGRCRVSKKA